MDTTIVWNSEIQSPNCRVHSIQKSALINDNDDDDDDNNNSGDDYDGRDICHFIVWNILNYVNQDSLDYAIINIKYNLWNK
jgi:hypothetical protein